MKINGFTLISLVIMISGLLVSGCSGAASSTTAETNPAPQNNAPAVSAAPDLTVDPNKSAIPTFPQLQPVPPEQQAILAKPVEAQAKGADVNIKVEAKFYTTTASARDVAAFYQNQLKDWKADIGGPGYSGQVSMQWTKDLQSFTIIYAPDDTTPGSFLVMTSQMWK
jgi:hypothetical protein